MAHPADHEGKRPVSGTAEEIQARRARKVGRAVLRERGAAAVQPGAAQ